MRNRESVMTSRELLREVLAQEKDSIFERRIQAICFLSELSWREVAEVPLSDATFQRVPWSVYSPEIREALDEIDGLYSRVGYDRGHRTTKYHSGDVVSERAPGDGAYDIINHTVSVCRDYDARELMDWCIYPEYVSEMETGETIDLAEYPFAEFF